MKNKAFTLAELLMAVLVISIIMVALAPVITKRVSDNLNVGNSTPQKGQEAYLTPGEYEFEVPEGINVLHIRAAGGGGAGGKAIRTIAYKNSYQTEGTKKYFSWYVPQGVVKIDFKITGAGGHGGNSGSYRTSETCDNGTHVNFTRADNDGFDLCVKRNSEMSIPSGVNLTAINNAGNSGGPNCWYGNSMQKYCNYAAAILMCNYPYHLLGEDQAKLLAKIQLYGPTPAPADFIPYARIYTNGCPTGNPIRHCSDSWWAGTSGGLGIVSGIPKYLSSTDEAGVNARQVRCVKIFKPYNNYSGRGGSSGAILSGTMEVKSGDLLQIYTGNASDSATSNGEDAYIHHWSYEGDPELHISYVEGYLVTAGRNGRSATSSGTGVQLGGPELNPANMCRKCKNDSCTNYTNINCTYPSYAGTAAYDNTVPSADSGGSPHGISSVKSAPGGKEFIDPDRAASQIYTAAEAEAAKGINAALYQGQGGGGGFGPNWARGQTFEGGKGTGSLIEISYTVEIAGAGGGGGAKVDGKAPDGKPYEILYKVTPGETIKIKVGAGGTPEGRGDGEATLISHKTGADNTIRLEGGGGGNAFTTAMQNKISSSPLLGFEKFWESGASGSIGTLYKWLGYKNTSNPVYGGITHSYDASFAKLSHNNVSWNDFNGRNGTLPSQSFEIMSTQFSGQRVYNAYGSDGGFGSGCPSVINPDIKYGACPGNILPNVYNGTTLGSCNTWSGYGNGEDGWEIKEADVNNYNAACHGGMGGGGVGVRYPNQTKKAGSGSSGYVIIRWNSTDNTF